MRRKKGRGKVLLGCIGVGVGLWFLWQYLRLPLTVAAVSWGVGAAVAPMARFCEKRFHLPRKAGGILCFLFLFLGLCALLSLGVAKLCEALIRLTVWLAENRGTLSESFGETAGGIGRLLSRLPFASQQEAEEWTLRIQTLLNERLGTWIVRIGNAAGVGIGRVLAATPRALLAGIVTVVACVYTSMEYERIRDGALRLLPLSLRARLDRVCKSMPHLLFVLLRAYGGLLLITFAELWIGLSVLRVRGALWLAALIALVDLLPVLGTGTVLIPWSIWSILSGEAGRGIGLAVLYAVVTVVRQIVEPYFLSKSMGVHPFVSLLAMLTGLELFGFVGMIVSPMIVFIVRATVQEEAEPS